MDGYDEFDLDNIKLPPDNHLFYSIVNKHSKPPYYCSCIDKLFLKRQTFQRHMYNHQGIMIPYKKTFQKRKADEIDDGVTVLKEFKRYYTNLFILVIDYLTKLKLGESFSGVRIIEGAKLNS